MSGNLGHLAATVSLNIDPFKASARTLSSTIKATTAELRAQDTAFKGSEKSLSGMKTVYSTLSSQSKNYSAQLARQKAEYDKLTAAVKSGTGDTEKLTTRQANAAAAYNKTAAQMAAVQNRMAALNKQILLQESGWTKAATGATHFATVTGKVGSGLTSLGSKATMGITVPIIAAFTAASKKAIEFDNTMLETKNLMESGGETAKEAISGVSTMTSDAVKYSNHYGVSVQNIAAGYQDLVKRGYTSKQAIGAMKSELQASLASGDDFNDVVTVASQTLEAFGMKAQTTAAMTANTKTVVNDLAYAADLTSSSFSDLGIGMSYVGSTAHQAGFSLSETSAALGILSNNGLEGQKAGTGLRKVLISLNSAVGAISSKNSVLAKLGIQKADMVDANGNLKSMSDIMEVLAKHTQDMNGVQKAAVFNSLFGTTGQQAGIILANNAKQLAALNDQVAKSGKNDYVGKLSEKNLQSAANQLKIFKESVTNLGMALAENLLPQITPLLNKASQMAQAFGKLDKSTQQQIVRWGLFAAAIGPVSTVLGSVFKVASGGGKIFAGLFSTLARGSVAAKTGATGLDLLRQTFSKTAFEAASGSSAISESTGQLSLFKTATEGAAAGGTSWLAALAPVAPTLLGVTAAVAAGYAAWKIWGEKAAESSDRATKWGTDIGAAADKAAGKMADYEGTVTHALSDTSQSASDNAKTINNAFTGMAKSAEQAADKQYSAAKKLASYLGGSAGSDLMAAANKQKAANNKQINNLQDYAVQVKSITKASRDSNVSLTAEQNQLIANLQNQAAAAEVKTLGLSQKEQTQVLKVELNARTSLTKQQAEDMQWDTEHAAQTEVGTYKTKMAKIKDTLTKGTAEYDAAVEGLEKDHNSKMDQLGLAQIKAMQERGVSMSAIWRNMKQYGWTDSEINSAMAAYKKALKGGEDSATSFAAKVTASMSGTVKKAGNDWNSLVLDPKTGKVKTNLADVLKDTANTKKGWSELTFDLKNAKISSNAKQVIVEALAASKQWQSMPTWEKNAIIRTQGRTELAQIMDDFVNWDQFSLKQQQAIVKGDYTPLINALVKADQWNNLSLKEKQALVKNKASEPIMDALVKSGTWNSLSLKEQQAVVSAKGLPDLTDIIIKFGLWNKLTPKQKTLLIQDADARKKLTDAGLLVDKYNLNNPKTKVAKADTANVSNNFGLATKAVTKYKNTSPGDTKKAKATDNASANLGKATKSTKTFADTTVGPTKLAKASNLASGGLDAATRSTNAFKGSSTGATKVAKAKDNASKTLSIATQSWKNLGGNETVNKIVNFTANIAKGAKSLLSKFFATGTQDFEGGLAVVNDAPGSVYREAITLPNGQTVSVAGRNVMLPLPRHTKIETAMQSARKYSIPRFANGTSDFTGAVSKINQVSVQTVTPTASVDGDNSLTDAVDTLNKLVAAMLNSKQQFTGEVTLDNKRVVGSWIADTVRTEIQRLDKIKNRNVGVV